MNETEEKEKEKDLLARLLLWNGGSIVWGSLEKHIAQPTKEQETGAFILCL